MLSRRRLTVLIIPEEGSTTYEYKVARYLVWVAGILGVAVVLLLVLGLRSHLIATRLRDRVARLEQEKGVLTEQVGQIRNLEVTLRRLEQSNSQLRQIASSAVGLETPAPVERELGPGGEHYIPTVERLRWGRIRTVPGMWPVRGEVVVRFDGQHRGVVIGAPAGSLVRASAAGRVARVGLDRALGHTVEIDHGNLVSSRYGYVGTVLVTAGQYVYMGQPIALTGSSGTAPMPSLFYAVEEDGVARDPETFRLWL
ncbi:MAG: peptidoglycan DD-metalloendopeptidase family protein [Gemmatimonadota bacterium]